MIRTNFCGYSDAYIHVKATIAIQDTAAAAAPVNNTNKIVIFKTCASFSKCISEINNAELDDAQDIDIVMLMYNLIEYSNVYLKASGSLWQYYRNEPAQDNNNNSNNNNNNIDFSGNNNNSISFKFKLQITGQIGNGGTKRF